MSTSSLLLPYTDKITTGDARELAQSIPDECIDLIFTDPPYLQEHLSLYDWLGQEAARVLKPGGLLCPPSLPRSTGVASLL